MTNLWFDLETFSAVPIKDGTHRYAEGAEVMLWAFAIDDGTVFVWDLVNRALHWQDDLSGLWVQEPCEGVPPALESSLADPEVFVWGHNAGMFDFAVLDRTHPELIRQVPWTRRRDTMIQAYVHSMPGSLELLGRVMGLTDDKRKLADGKKLIHLFCKPQGEAFVKKHGTARATKQTHPAEWQRFVEYAGGDIVTMREIHRLLPKWNLTPKQWKLWEMDMRANHRGFAVDLGLARGAMRASDAAKSRLAERTYQLTDGEVQAATQRDALLQFIFKAHGIELPDMRAATLEELLKTEELSDSLRELLLVRLQASMNSVSKFRTLLKGVNSDSRLRGTMQFRGAARTGRCAHRMFQPGNLMRPTMLQAMIELAIECIKNGSEDLVFN